jgi:hypothetical protein
MQGLLPLRHSLPKKDSFAVQKVERKGLFCRRSQGQKFLHGLRRLRDNVSRRRDNRRKIKKDI